VNVDAAQVVDFRFGHFGAQVPAAVRELELFLLRAERRPFARDAELNNSLMSVALKRARLS
jgi:hypothetical protein